MSKSKSLGSSPIGLQSNNSTLSFIPDRGVSSERKSSSCNGEASQNRDQKKKKVVSYYLEESLISKLKSKAEEKDIYYSTLVGRAIKEWLEKNTQDHKPKINQHPFVID